MAVHCHVKESFSISALFSCLGFFFLLNTNKFFLWSRRKKLFEGTEEMSQSVEVLIVKVLGPDFKSPAPSEPVWTWSNKLISLTLRSRKSSVTNHHSHYGDLFLESVNILTSFMSIWHTSWSYLERWTYREKTFPPNLHMGKPMVYFFRLMIDGCGRPRSLWAVPLLGWYYWAKKQDNKHYSSMVSESAPAFRFLS